MPDPDLEIRGGGGGWTFRPLDKWGGGGVTKNNFWPVGPQLFGLKIRGRGRWDPGPSPGSTTDYGH